VNAQVGPLFRQEVLLHRRDRLHGAVSLATPMAWQVIGFVLLTSLAIAICFLCLASYARIETVNGAISLDTGVATIVPSRAGVIAGLAVKEGQHVSVGDVLVRIRSEEDMTAGGTAPDAIRRSLDEQGARLAAQGALLLEASVAERQRVRAQIAGLGSEIVSLDQQVADQRALLNNAAREYADVSQVALKGFISKRDLEAREATMLSRRQQLSQLEQLRAARRADIAAAERSMVQSAAQAQAQVAGAEANRAALAQQAAQAELARGYALTSPVDGVVTALTARIGQPATGEQPLMLVVPASANTRVELAVPTAAAGFIARGQEVRVAIDAFPYQRFGAVTARVSEVSGAAVARQGPNGPVPVYLVTAKLDQPWVRAFGRKQMLLPGMTLSARIVTEKRSLFEWLFEPVFAVRNR